MPKPVELRLQESLPSATPLPLPPPAPQGFFRLSAKSSDDRGACGVLTTSSYPTKKV